MKIAQTNYNICVSSMHHPKWWCLEGVEVMYKDTSVSFFVVALIHWWNVSNMVDLIMCSDVDILVIWEQSICQQFTCQEWEQFVLVIQVCEKLIPISWDFGSTGYTLSGACSSFFPCASFDCQCTILVPYFWGNNYILRRRYKTLYGLSPSQYCIAWALLLVGGDRGPLTGGHQEQGPLAFSLVTLKGKTASVKFWGIVATDSATPLAFFFRLNSCIVKSWLTYYCSHFSEWIHLHVAVK